MKDARGVPIDVGSKVFCAAMRDWQVQIAIGVVAESRSGMAYVAGAHSRSGWYQPTSLMVYLELPQTAEVAE